MRADWKLIPKDKDGFFDENSDLYEQLPIIIARIEDNWLCYDVTYVDQENWDDAQSDLNKESYKYYACVEPIDL